MIQIFSRIFAKIASIAFSTFFGIYSIGGVVGEEPPKARDDFTPVLRFAVCSDIHLDGDENQQNAKEFAELFTQCYEYSEKHDSYNALDAVMVCGDMTEWGRETEYSMFAKIIDENCAEDTQMLVCMGNHEFIEERETEGINAFDNYFKYVSPEADTHTVINGYHFIGVSYCDKDENFGEKTEWLRQELDKAVADTGNAPIFVFQHPHPTLTVYGSIHWGDMSIKGVLKDYPQVVDFSGHSHYTPTDPRSIWQGSFTAIGTGSLSGLLGNPEYLHTDTAAAVPSASYYIVEVDAAGNIRLQLYDAANDTFFEECDYYLSDVADVRNHYYSWNNMKKLDTAPLFPEEAQISAELNSDGETLICFPDAKGYYDAQLYRITVTNRFGISVYSSSVVSDYVVAVDDGMKVNIGIVESGKYFVTVTPVSPYYKTGRCLTGSITVE